MARPRLIPVVLALFATTAPAAGPAAAPAAAEATAAYKTVDIDDYAAKQRPVKPGTRTLLPPQYLMFTARIDQPPRAAKTEYVKLAMSVLGIADPPPIGHQMLLATPGGQRLPVYVEDAAVPMLAGAGAAKAEGRFHGYHIYTYSKGPAIVISGFAPK